MATSAKDRFIEIGRIGRPRGLDGVVRFMPNEIFNADLFNHVALLYMRNKRSDLVPARIERVYTESKRNQLMFFVKFDMIANRSDADEAMNRALFVEKEHAKNLVEITEDSVVLNGFTVFADGSEFGRVLDVLQNPAHPILEVKHSDETVLIPMVDEFVESTDPVKGIVFCKNLDLLTGL
jgi:16S rRNA processing protein RimM